MTDRAARPPKQLRHERRRAKLERRYRLLLALYPPAHRRKHADEMTGILLADATDSGPWNAAADTADLIVGALRTWLQLLTRTVSDPSWPRTKVPGKYWADTLAMASVIFPLGLLAAAVGDLGLPQAAVHGTAVPVLLTFWPLTFGAPAAAAAALLGMRRATAIIALTTAACLAVTIPPVRADPAADLADLLGVVAGAAALLSAGPRRGLTLIPPWGIALTAAGALAMASVSEDPASLYPDWAAFPHQGLWSLVTGPSSSAAPAITGVSAVVAATAISVCLWTPARRRLLLLLTVPAIPYVFLLKGDLSPTITYLSTAPAAGSSPPWLYPLLAAAVTAIIGISRASRFRRSASGQSSRRRPEAV